MIARVSTWDHGRQMRIINQCLPLMALLLTHNIRALESASPPSTIVNSTAKSIEEFAITQNLADGETQRTIKWRGICARETIVNWGDTSVALREVLLEHSGKKLQLIYEGDSLTDCIQERSIYPSDDVCRRDNDAIASPHVEINDNFYVFQDMKNSSLSQDFFWLADSRDLVRKCRLVRWKARNQALKQHVKHRRVERGLQQMFIAPGTKWCGPHRIASSYRDLGGLDSVDRCCRRHDHCSRAILPFSERYNFWNYMPFTLSHCGCDQTRQCEPAGRSERRKRSRRRRELFLMPGTQWCGRGNRATKYTNLGGFGKADACCRRHDTQCPFYIPAFETRYGLFNWGISTLMHCTCDERFRTCLKMAGTSSANLIGRIFFNVVQTKCFVLKPQKVCVKSSWWGKCEKHAYRKQAHLRNNIPY